MLRSLKEIFGYELSAADGDIGHCKDVLFDDHKWTIRYLDVDTGGWLFGRRVLLSPISLESPEWSSEVIPSLLTKKQIEMSPSLDEHAPVSRQWEKQFYNFYDWPHYAMGMHMWGLTPYPYNLFNVKSSLNQKNNIDHNSHLRSANEVFGYNIDAKGEHFGSVKDFIFDDQTWAVRYLVIDMTKWVPNRSVLIPPQWVDTIDWSLQTLSVDMSKTEIKESPDFRPNHLVDHDYERRLYEYHGRPNYWDREDKLFKNMEQNERI